MLHTARKSTMDFYHGMKLCLSLIRYIALPRAFMLSTISAKCGKRQRLRSKECFLTRLRRVMHPRYIAFIIF